MEIWDYKKFEDDLEQQEELIRLILEQFLSDSEGLMTQLKNASNSSKLQSSITPLAHALKGAAAQVRCEALANVCYEIEQLTHNKDSSSKVQVPIHRLQHEYDRAVALIRDYCRFD